MSLRHTLKTLLAGPQTQVPPTGGYAYNQAPGASPHQPQHFGSPGPYGYHQPGPTAHGGNGGPAGPYTSPQGQSAMAPDQRSYGGFAFPPTQQQQQQPQTFHPFPQQHSYQYDSSQASMSPGPAGPVSSYNNNNNTFTPHNNPMYQSSSSLPPTGNTFQHHPPLLQSPHLQQHSHTPFAAPNFLPNQLQLQRQQLQPHYAASYQHGIPPPIPSATHPSHQQSAATKNTVCQYANTTAPTTSLVQQEQQQPPLSPPPPYMQFEQQPSLAQAIPKLGQPSTPAQSPSPGYVPPAISPELKTPAGHSQQQQQYQPMTSINPQLPTNSYNAGGLQIKSIGNSDTGGFFDATPQPVQNQAESVDLPQQPSATHQSIDAPNTLVGIIHPSMLAQWSVTSATKSDSDPKLPPAQPQSPPEPARSKLSNIDQNSPPPQPTYPGGRTHKPTGSVNRSFTFSKKNADGSPNWSGTLLTIDGISSETFTRFINGLYNFAGQAEDPLGLTPDQLGTLLERLGMPDERNYPKKYSLRAQKANASDPTSFVNTSLISYYSIFDVTYITEANLMPIVTRDGFQQYMTTEVLIDPSAMHRRFMLLLANFGYQIIDPSTKNPFGNVQFERECLPPVPNDQYVARDKKQTEALQAREEASTSYYSGGRPQIGETPHSSSWGI